mgnify:CR=1 FL=1
MQFLKEFKPTIFFLVKFLAFYLIGSLLYGWYISSWHPNVDPITSEVADQTSILLNVLNWETSVFDHYRRPTSNLVLNDKAILAIYEGCNGVNVTIVFVGFLLAFGQINKRLYWFIPVGLLAIHAGNLLRIVLLFFVSTKLPDFMYFAHKYLFTAFIYLIVFVLWIWWVRTIPKPVRQ